MKIRDLLFVGVIAGGTAMLGLGLFRPAVPKIPASVAKPASGQQTEPVVTKIDEAFRERWKEHGVRPSPMADGLTVMRRMNLALTGSIPSLAEIRRFESLPVANRLDLWAESLLNDRRSADYLAERFARVFVGTEDGPFIIFRRRRFVSWLGDAIHENRPYDAVVRDMITAEGLWTDHPSTNFLSVTLNLDTRRPDPERLAARVSRAFLGARIDCAQCHDHPFQPWKQADFRGLSAFFGNLTSSGKGIHDANFAYEPTDRKTKQTLVVPPSVPFLPELRPDSGPPRDQLAAWITAPRNRRFGQATANRVWALLLGQPMVEPIDELLAPEAIPPALDLLADDFASHGYDLRRLFRVIASTQVFRMQSGGVGSDSEAVPGEAQEAWLGTFPMTRLRPEQVGASLFQTASITTIDTQSPWIIRLSALTGRNDFVKRYGDAGDDEFDDRSGTILQRLLLMNGDLVRDKVKEDLFTSVARIASQAPDDRHAVEAAYLTVLARRPTPEESEYFSRKLAGTIKHERADRMVDLFWTLLNATEFSWNH